MATRARTPQLALRLEAAPAPAAAWCDGRPLAYLGGTLTLCLDRGVREASQQGDELHLPLPPEASPRQIQDAAESWLRAHAQRNLAAQLVMECRRAGRPAPALSLSFANRAPWTQIDDRGGLRCHWRLIEQTQEVIAQVIGRAVATLPPSVETLDLFALA
jgi:predicted metal-dependent hydrolase